MNGNLLRVALIAAALLGLLAAVRLAAWPLVRITLPPAYDSVSTSRSSAVTPRISAESVAAIASGDPFRIARRPALPAYDPLRLAEQLAPPPPRPSLIVVGVLDGAQPSAVIEGFPGVEGARVVRIGDVIAGLAIKRIGSGRVVISGIDTTWVLPVREPWKN